MELEDLITDDVLNENLQKSTNLDTFNKLLEIKTKRLIEGKTNKIHLSLEQIYCDCTSVEIRCEILQKALKITENPNYKTITDNLIEQIDFNIIINEEKAVNILKFLNVFIKHSLNENQEIQQYFMEIGDVIDTILKRCTKQSTNYIITQFLPDYLQLQTVDESKVLSQLFQTLKHTNRIEILYNLIDTCILTKNDYRLFQILKIINIWETLQASLITNDYHQQKHAKYLLQKIIDLFFDRDEIYIKSDDFSGEIVRKSWRNFFIVLDTSHEKQLHLIQPSLKLLETLKYLHYTWQICLYRILLKHTQHSVVYFTAISILQQSNDAIFKQICYDLFNAVNLNEYSQISIKFFQELSDFFKRLSCNEITEILEESLKISWNPTTIWCFYSCIFFGGTHSIDINIIEKFLEKIKCLPNIFVRDSLNRLILDCITSDFVPDSCQQLLKFFNIIDKFDTNRFDECLVKFEMYLIRYQIEIEGIFLENRLDYEPQMARILQKLQSNVLIDQKVEFRPNCEEIHKNCLDNNETVDNLLRDFDKYRNWQNPKELGADLELLLRHCSTLNVVEALLENFHKILELEFDEILYIFVRYLTNFIQFSNDSEPIRCFVADLFERILRISNNNLFKKTMTVLIDNLTNIELIDDRILDFIRISLKLANSYLFNTDLMEKLSKITTEKPELFYNDFSIFINTIFDRNIINKHEKIEYCLNQDISQKLNITKLNPNLDYLLVRLFAIDSLMNLAKSNRKIADSVIACLLEMYKVRSRKRYFPNSQIHIEKLRITQILVLLQPHIEHTSDQLITFVIDSFLNESHQLSVKYLMQLLLINLLTTKQNSIKIIADALEQANYNRPTSISSFIPVLYQLTLQQNESVWDQVVKILLNYTMGPQFRLRLCSQLAIMKLYETANDRKFQQFTTNYQYLYQSVRDVVESTDNNALDDFFKFDSNDTTVFYRIPKVSQVIPIEWENLQIIIQNYKFYNLSFNHDIIGDKLTQLSIDSYEINTDDFKQFDNIQKKIIPWRDNIIDNNLSDFILVTTLIEKSSNLGGLSRTCEIFRIKQFVLNTINILNDREFKSLSMSSENWMNFIEIKSNDLQQFLIDIKAKGYCCIGAEQTSDSIKLQQFPFPKLTVLVLGNEKEGIPPNLLPYLDYCIEIPQFGVVRSLNVHVAGAIFIWEYCKQHLL